MNSVSDPVKAQVLLQEIRSLLEKGSVTRVDLLTQQDGLYSIYFMVLKEDNTFSPVLDLKQFNAFLKVLPFRMLSTVNVLHILAAGEWFITLDLKDAYFHVPVHPEHRKFLRFAFLGQADEFAVLTFRPSLTPRVFTRSMGAALSSLCLCSKKLLPYLDDWLICTPSYEHTAENTSLILADVEALGLTVNYANTSLTQSQQITFIGVFLDS